MSTKEFVVEAGKWEPVGERFREKNTKYIETFDTFSDALIAWKKVQDYPWSSMSKQDKWEN